MTPIASMSLFAEQTNMKRSYIIALSIAAVLFIYIPILYICTIRPLQTLPQISKEELAARNEYAGGVIDEDSIKLRLQTNSKLLQELKLRIEENKKLVNVENPQPYNLDSLHKYELQLQHKEIEVYEDKIKLDIINDPIKYKQWNFDRQIKLKQWDYNRYIELHNTYIFSSVFMFFLLNVPLGLIPAIIAKRKGLCSKQKGRCSFMVWWFYGTLLFVISLPHSLISKADVQAVEKIKQDAERDEQRRRDNAERAEHLRK